MVRNPERLYEQGFNAMPPDERKIRDPRWRIEHAQIVESSLYSPVRKTLVSSRQCNRRMRSAICFSHQLDSEWTVSSVRTRGKAFSNPDASLPVV
jgi:hypothetical protein